MQSSEQCAKTTHLSFAILAISKVLTFQDGKSSIEQQFTKTFDAVPLPILDSVLELLDGLPLFFLVDCSICAVENRGRCLHAVHEVLLSLFIQIALLMQLFQKKWVFCQSLERLHQE